MVGRSPTAAQVRRRRVVALAVAVLVAAALVGLLLALAGDDGGGRGYGPAERRDARQGTTAAGAAERGGAARIVPVAIESEAVGATLPVNVLVPARPGPVGERALLVFLHGAGGDETSFNETVQEGIESLPGRQPLVAFPYGEESWWHDRASGEWGRYVVEEAIPAIGRRFGADPRRVAVGGISMGGYGAYHLGLAHPGRFCAVGGHSAGLWLDRSEEYPGAFDDRADYERNDVLAAVESNPDAFGETPIWNDYGDRDWFVPGNQAFVAALRRGGADLTARVWPGGHEASYWEAHWPAYQRFYVYALRECQ